jgi:hypothetical protein
MNHELTVELSEVAFAALSEEAKAASQTEAEVAAAALEKQFGIAQRRSDVNGVNDAQARRARFERHFGSVDLGRPTGVDNEGIDRDLAKAYANELPSD